MGDTRTSNLGGPILARGRALFSGRLFERLRHVLWAGLVSLALFAVLLFEPVDQFLWLIQSRIADRSPSGDVVFVASDEALNAPDLPQRRYEVAAALDELDRRGVGKVFLDVTFEKSDDPKADERLSRAIADLGPRVTLVDRIVVASNGRSVVRGTTPEIAGPVSRVVSDQTDRNWFGLAWELQYSYIVDGKPTAALGAAIGGVSGRTDQKFAVDYGFSQTRIPILPVEQLIETKRSAPDSPVDVTGKTVILGHSNRVTGPQQPIPGRMDAPASFVDIYAGETLKAGRTRHFRAPSVLALFALLQSVHPLPFPLPVLTFVRHQAP